MIVCQTVTGKVCCPRGAAVAIVHLFLQGCRCQMIAVARMPNLTLEIPVSLNLSSVRISYKHFCLLDTNKLESLLV